MLFVGTRDKSFLKRGVALLGAAIFCMGASGLSSTAVASGTAFLPVVSASPPPSGALQLCDQYSWACASATSVSMSGEREMELVRRINRHVNASTREVTDQSQYRMQERWALPTRRGGDCEDFALLKKRELIRAGIDPSKLLIATVLDRKRNAHAVLVYRSSQGDLVLDNLTNRIKPWSVTRYLFLRMQDPRQPRNWVGVYLQS